MDSGCRARLADFGLAVVIDESTTGSTPDHRGIRGTIRWMAPEMIYPERFGFAGEHRKRLPSRSTDIYSLGMTILEVSMFNSLPNPSSKISCNSLCRSLPGVPRSAASPQRQLSCAKLSKGTDPVDHLQGSRINCGNC